MNVNPSPAGAIDAAARARDLRQTFARMFGFREVLTRSWQLAGWIHGARDAADADVLLEPRTREHSPIEFSARWLALVDAGRASVREHAAEILAAASDNGVMPSA